MVIQIQNTMYVEQRLISKRQTMNFLKQAWIIIEDHSLNNKIAFTIPQSGSTVLTWE